MTKALFEGWKAEIDAEVIGLESEHAEAEAELAQVEAAHTELFDARQQFLHFVGGHGPSSSHLTRRIAAAVHEPFQDAQGARERLRGRIAMLGRQVADRRQALSEIKLVLNPPDAPAPAAPIPATAPKRPAVDPVSWPNGKPGEAVSPELAAVSS